MGLSVAMLQAMLCVLLVVLTGCPGSQPRGETSQKEASYQSPEEAVTIMTFNVENLFDARNDKNKIDDTYLPKPKKVTRKHRRACAKLRQKEWRRQCFDWDWNDNIVKLKLERVASVIRSARGGKGPDIVVLQEVENRSILERLRKEYLNDLGYRPSILIEGNDYRGIDVAILTRFRLFEKPELHEVPFIGVSNKSKGDTRGILQATLILPDRKKLTVFAVHFPAPFHPVTFRAQAMTYLNLLAERLPPERMMIAAGDFNVIDEEVEKYGFYEKHISSHWLIAHKMGCAQCSGTNYYPPKKTWSFLDMILSSPNMSPHTNTAGWALLPNSVRILKGIKEQLSEEGTPVGFDPETKLGVSDHLPLVLDLVPSKWVQESASDPGKP